MRRSARPLRTDREAPRPLAIRLAWFVGIWLASIGALGTVAYAIRLWLVP